MRSRLVSFAWAVLLIVWVGLLGQRAAAKSATFVLPLVDIIVRGNSVILLGNSRIPSEHVWVASFDARSGKQLWHQELLDTSTWWPLVPCGNLLCIETTSRGVYLVESATGAFRGRVNCPVIGVFPRVTGSEARMLVTGDPSKGSGTVSVSAYDIGRLKKVWQRGFQDVAEIYPLSRRKDSFDIEIRYRAGSGGTERVEQVTLRASDGRVLAHRTAKWQVPTPPGQAEPDSAVRNWVKKTFRYPKAVNIVRDRGQMWFAADVDGHVPAEKPARIYGVRSDGRKAAVVWKRDVPGHSKMVAQDGKLIVAIFDKHEGREADHRLVALDARTGKQLWTVRVRY